MDATEITELARRLGKLPKRKRYQQTCPVCGRQFETTKRGIYCSANCRAKAQYRRRHQPTGAAEQAEKAS